MSSEPSRNRWQIPVLDPETGRSVHFTLYVTGNMRVLMPPPGSAWLITPTTDERFAKALRESLEAVGHDQ